MDLFLTQNAPQLVELVTEAYNNYAPYFEDVTRDPIYCIYGYPTQTKVDSEVREYKEETEKVLDFAGTYAVCIEEMELNTDEDKFIFALQYLSIEISEDMEYQAQEQKAMTA